MPYIQLINRDKFKESIADALAVMNDANDTLYVKGEYLGYFVNRVCRRYLADPDYTQQSFNSAYFNESKKKALSSAADTIAALINRADPISGAGELNYALTSVLWGYMGECQGFPQVGYGLRAYIDGILDKVKESIKTINTGSQRDMAMTFRRHIVIRGVLNHMLKETYRRKHVPYEDQKLQDNGDIWAAGNLILGPEQD